MSTKFDDHDDDHDDGKERVYTQAMQSLTIMIEHTNSYERQETERGREDVISLTKYKHKGCREKRQRR